MSNNNQQIRSPSPISKKQFSPNINRLKIIVRNLSPSIRSTGDFLEAFFSFQISPLSGVLVEQKHQDLHETSSIQHINDLLALPENIKIKQSLDQLYATISYVHFKQVRKRLNYALVHFTSTQAMQSFYEKFHNQPCPTPPSHQQQQQQSTSSSSSSSSSSSQTVKTVVHAPSSSSPCSSKTRSHRTTPSIQIEYAPYQKSPRLSQSAFVHYCLCPPSPTSLCSIKLDKQEENDDDRCQQAIETTMPIEKSQEFQEFLLQLQSNTDETTDDNTSSISTTPQEPVTTTPLLEALSARRKQKMIAKKRQKRRQRHRNNHKKQQQQQRRGRNQTKKQIFSNKKSST